MRRGRAQRLNFRASLAPFTARRHSLHANFFTKNDSCYAIYCFGFFIRDGPGHFHFHYVHFHLDMTSRVRPFCTTKIIHLLKDIWTIQTFSFRLAPFKRSPMRPSYFLRWPWTI